MWVSLLINLFRTAKHYNNEPEGQFSRDLDNCEAGVRNSVKDAGGVNMYAMGIVGKTLLWIFGVYFALMFMLLMFLIGGALGKAC
jgi:hypothetical protein